MPESFVVAICPTYRRPECLQNALACWRWQDHPGRRHLLILDDGGDFVEQAGADWTLLASKVRYTTLPDKFNALLAEARSMGATHIVTWEDDDGYLPRHLTQTMDAMNGGQWAHPRRAWVSDGNGVRIEVMEGRGHAGWGYQAERGEPGYPQVDPGFDLAFGRVLGGGSDKWAQEAANPTAVMDPTYVYRWGVAGPYHGSAMGAGFYDRVGREHPQQTGGGGRLEPKFDRNMLKAARVIGCETEYLDLVEQPSDMQGHVQRLTELAAGCEIVREFGVRSGVSTRALLAGRPEYLSSYDLRRPANIEQIYAAARSSGTEFLFTMGDSRELAFPSEQIDLLMIDTLHTAAQLQAELAKQSHTVKIGGRLVMHDTATYGERGEDGGRGLLYPIRDLLSDGRWITEREYKDSHGLMVLRRVA